MSEAVDRTTYEGLRREGLAALAAGDLFTALERFDDALAEAERIGDAELVDRAFCNRSAVSIGLGDWQGPQAQLRRILMQNGARENCALAAYNLTRSYEVGREPRKALFYAQIARDRARELGWNELLASSHNQIGNQLVALDRVTEAIGEYDAALELLNDPEDPRRAPSFWQNRGYALVLAGELDEGRRLLVRSLRLTRRHGRERALIHLDLAYVYLELARPGPALRHARRAVTLAELENTGNGDLKNALYLLGEAANGAGDSNVAHEAFDRLARYYPDTPYLSQVLLQVNLRGLVNLRA